MTLESPQIAAAHRRRRVLFIACAANMRHQIGAVAHRQAHDSIVIFGVFDDRARQRLNLGYQMLARFFALLNGGIKTGQYVGSQKILHSGKVTGGEIQ